MRKIDLAAERAFENDKVNNGGMIRVSQKVFYEISRDFVESFNSEVSNFTMNKNVLEIGCSSGELAAIYSENARRYTGVDLSDAAIQIAKEKSLKNCEFIECDAHSLPFPDNSFDLIVVNSLLHHLDLTRAVSEIKRVLAEDGRFAYREPLGTNIAFNLYRYVTPHARTVDEQPFRRQELQILESNFKPLIEKYFGFTIVPVAKLTRNKIILKFFRLLDSFLANTFMRKYFWQYYVVCEVK